jgi:ComF family protein
VTRFVDGLLAVLIAPSCAACGLPLERASASVVCNGCWNSIQPLTAPFCSVCGDPLMTWRAAPDHRCAACRLNRPHITRGRAVGEYDGALRAILQALKYEGRKSLAPQISALMRLRGRSILGDADYAVPVPLHWRRHWRRGFNQAALLAAGLGLPVIRGLRRVRHTPSQTDLPASRRRANVRDAFLARHATRLRRRCVVVVDDVSTTGATLDACAKALLDAGVGEVRTLTAARVVTRLPASPRR